MDVSISREREAFVESAVNDGRYPSVAAVVEESLRLLEERERKLKDLRDTIDASIARGGANTSEDVRRHLQRARQEREAKRT